MDEQPIFNVIRGTPSANGNWQSVYNEDYLYFYIAVYDQDPAVSNSSNIWEDDSVEIIIDGNNNRSSTYDAFDVQYMFKPGVSTAQMGPNSQGYQGRERSTLNIKVASFVASDGYAVEIAIPWTTLGMTPEPGLRFGIDVQINDDDTSTGPERDGKTAWFADESVGDVAWELPTATATVELGW